MTGSTRTLPNLIIIGAQKCGTTSLHAALSEHPDIAMSAVKEVNFFTWHWERGLDWYAARFEDAPVRGESTPEYSMQPGWPAVPARMAATIPDVRLVYVTRDPVDRVVSHWLHATAAGVWDRSFAATVHDPAFGMSEFALRTRYASQEDAYLRHFSADHLLVTSMERLVRDPTTTLGQVLAHVGLDPRGAADLVLPQGNSSPRSRPPWLARRIRQRGGIHRPFGALEARAFSALSRWFARPLNRPVVRPEDREAILGSIRSDLDLFSSRHPDVVSSWRDGT